MSAMPERCLDCGDECVPCPTCGFDYCPDCDPPPCLLEVREVDPT